MAYITEGDLRSKSNIAKSKFYRTSNQILNESYRNFSSYKTYDIFLSHSFKDADLILGLKEYLESELNLTVYVDWIEDSQLNRSSVNRETADLLRTRMRSCRSLIYAASSKSIDSRWMPWELGYFDGYKHGKVAIMPITTNSNDQFKGEEYLLLYQYIEKISKLYSFEHDKLKISGNDLKNWIGL